MKKSFSIMVFAVFSVLGNAQNGGGQETTDQKETIVQQKIKVFPNPATKVVNILGLFNSSKASISIADISGTIVQEHQWAIRNNALSIPIPNLKSGIYIVHVYSKEQQIQAKFYKN